MVGLRVRNFSVRMLTWISSWEDEKVIQALEIIQREAGVCV